MQGYELGEALQATITAIRKIVAGLHNGEIPSQLTAKRSQYICWTPSFVQGAEPQTESSVPFNAQLLSMMLGNASPSGRPHQIVVMALRVLELYELGEIDEQDLEKLYRGTDELTQKMLTEILIEVKEAHYAEEAEQVLAAAR
jgi:hypothetical protein